MKTKHNREMVPYPENMLPESVIQKESVPIFSWRYGFIALKGGREAGAVGIAHLLTDLCNGRGGRFQQLLCLPDAGLVDIIHQFNSSAALEHMRQVGWADAEVVADHGCTEIGIAGLGVDIICDLRDVFPYVKTKGVIVIVQLSEAIMEQRNALVNAFGVFDALRIAIDLGAFAVAGISRHMQHN